MQLPDGGKVWRDYTQRFQHITSTRHTDTARRTGERTDSMHSHHIGYKDSLNSDCMTNWLHDSEKLPSGSLSYSFDWRFRCAAFSTEKKLRRENRRLFDSNYVIPSHRLTTYGRRAFSVAGPMFWNSLPAQTPAWPVTYWCRFWTITKNISFLRVLVYTVHQRHWRRCAI